MGLFDWLFGDVNPKKQRRPANRRPAPGRGSQAAKSSIRRQRRAKARRRKR